MKFKLTFLGILCFVFFQANDFFKFLESSKKETANSLLIFYRPDCPYCYKLDQEISVNQKLSALIKSDYNVTAIDISTPEGKNIAAYYQVRSVPMLIKYDKKNQSENLLGFQKTETLEKFLTNQKITIKSTKSAVCGDGIVETGEQCDDGNVNNGDGCTNSCTIQSGYTCSGNPSICTPSATCGNGIVEIGEQCDDGNLANGDGCTNSCTVQSGYTCSGNPSVCSVSLSTGEVNNVDILNLNIGPNPVSENLKIQFFLSNRSNLELSFADVSGRKIEKFQYKNLIIGANTIEINIKNKFSAGVYMLNFKFENGKNSKVVSKKIIVQ